MGFEKLKRDLKNYLKENTATMEVLRRDYYNIPIIFGVYWNTKPSLIPAQIVHMTFQLILMIMHVILISKTSISIMKVSFTLMAFEFQISLLISFSFVMLLLFLCRRDEMNILHAEMMHKMFKYEQDNKEFLDKLYTKTNQEKKRLLLGPVFAGIGTSNLLIAGPYLDSKLGSFDYNGTEVTGRSWSLPVPVTDYPISLDSPFSFYFAVLLEAMTSYYVVSIIGIAGFLFMHISQMVCLHLEYLMYTVDNLHERAKALLCREMPEYRKIKKSTRKWYQDPNFIRCYKKCLKRSLQHHQFIVRWMMKYQRLGSVPIGIGYTGGAIFIALSLLSIKTGSSLPGTLLSSLFLWMAEIGFMALLSHLGQRIIDLNEDLRFKMYNTKWYLCPTSVRSDIMIFQEMSIRPLKISGFGMITANNDTFSNVMNSAYTYYNVLMAF